MRPRNGDDLRATDTGSLLALLADAADGLLGAGWAFAGPLGIHFCAFFDWATYAERALQYSNLKWAVSCVMCCAVLVSRLW